MAQVGERITQVALSGYLGQVGPQQAG